MKGTPCAECGFRYLTEWTQDAEITTPPEWWDHDYPFPRVTFPVHIALCTDCGVLKERPI